jgi:hypothetical protein
LALGGKTVAQGNDGAEAGVVDERHVVKVEGDRAGVTIAEELGGVVEDMRRSRIEVTVDRQSRTSGFDVDPELSTIGTVRCAQTPPARAAYK